MVTSFALTLPSKKVQAHWILLKSQDTTSGLLEDVLCKLRKRNQFLKSWTTTSCKCRSKKLSDPTTCLVCIWSALSAPDTWTLVRQTEHTYSNHVTEKCPYERSDKQTIRWKWPTTRILNPKPTVDDLHLIACYPKIWSLDQKSFKLYGVP